jgi:hypothetical protein|tara:strand:- start:14 stop:508 length:495 start_codon:yes stop_codon:yes gene_type:complete
MINGIIYKIEIGKEFYVGSTKNLIERQYLHNSRLKKYSGKLYEICRANNINEIECIELEKVKVENKKELFILEQKYINELKPTLNSYNAYITEEEKKAQIKLKGIIYYENNKEKIKEKVNVYRKNNKEKIKEKKKERGICEFCNKEIMKYNLSRHKKESCSLNK